MAGKQKTFDEEQNIRGADHGQSETEGELRPLFNLVIQRFEGEVCEGQPSGEGVACFVGGHVYKGMFSKGLMDGHGVFTWAGGLKYEGDFVCNALIGHGAYTWPDGSTYQGEVHHGIRHGAGTYYCVKNDVLYKGQWHHGKRQGKGEVYYNQDKTNWYKGDWVKNNIEGSGVRRYISGNIYTGDWKNNLRHGKGTMKWLQSGQQYEGMWHNGVQHGRGTHTWILKREDGSRYSQSNQYVGDFVCGQRHGQGTFYYADGAVYEGEWRNNKKHGQGTFTFKNGKVFQGEFVEDQMMQLRNDGPPTLLDFTGLFYQSSALGPDMTLTIDQLLMNIPEKRRDAEHREVELAVLRHSTELRSVYSFYSRLGHSRSPDNTFMLSRLQFWRFLKDCKIHHHKVTLIEIDFLTREDASSTEAQSPFTGMLFRRLLTCLVVIAYHIYHKDMVSERDLLATCFSELMMNNILPNAKKVKGFLFKQQQHTQVAKRYFKRSYEVYQAYCTHKATTQEDKTMTYRDLLFMFKDFHLLDKKLTTTKFIEVITTESLDPDNPNSCLVLEITFLEFFETLLGCAEVKCQQDCDDLDEVNYMTERPESGNTKIGQTLQTKSPSLTVASPVSSPTFQVSCLESEVEASGNTQESLSVHDSETTVELHISEHTDLDDEGTTTQKPRQNELNNELDVWTQMVQNFFDQVFFEFEEHMVVKKLLKEKNMKLRVQSLKALIKNQRWISD